MKTVLSMLLIACPVFADPTVAPPGYKITDVVPNTVKKLEVGGAATNCVAGRTYRVDYAWTDGNGPSVTWFAQTTTTASNAGICFAPRGSCYITPQTADALYAVIAKFTDTVTGDSWSEFTLVE